MPKVLSMNIFLRAFELLDTKWGFSCLAIGASLEEAKEIEDSVDPHQIKETYWKLFSPSLIKWGFHDEYTVQPQYIPHFSACAPWLYSSQTKGWTSTEFQEWRMTALCFAAAMSKTGDFYV